MIIERQAEDAYRFERKFLVEDLSAEEMEWQIKLNPAFFREIYHERFVNNIYYDTNDFRYFADNVDGVADRLKVRVRWYGNLFGHVDKPVLEFKIKSGTTGRKQSYPLTSFTINEKTEAFDLSKILQDPSLPEGIVKELKQLNPVLLNRYNRKYFLSACKSYRLTLDNKLEFYTVNAFKEQLLKRVNYEVVIIELKHAPDKEKEASFISNAFKFRMTKSSKYVDGFNLLTMAKAV